MRILIVEDEKQFSDLLKVFLGEKLDADVMTTDKPREVQYLVEDFRPDVILLDLGLGGENGFMVLKKLKTNYYTKKIPIIILTGNKNAQALKMAIQLGANDYIVKPPETDHLVERILKLFQASQKTPGQKQKMGDTKVIKRDIPAARKQVLTFEQMVQRATKEVSKFLGSEEIDLPVLPQIAMDIQKKLKSSNVNLKEIAEMVKKDVGISAKILKIANSSFYCSVEKISDIHHAVSRIGIKEIKTIIQMISGNQLFEAPSPKYQSMMQRLWEHALCCAYSNQIIAKQLNIAQIDEFFLYGLLHDIGKVFLLKLVCIAVEKDKTLNDVMSEQVILELMRKMHSKLGVFMMDKWNYSTEYVDIVGFHHNPIDVMDDQPHMMVTCLSDLLSRKLKYSLEPFEGKESEMKEIQTVLGIDRAKLESLENDISEHMKKVKESFFNL